MNIVVVMPAHNEVEGITHFLTELQESLSHWATTFIVVDDASHDGTAEAVHALGSSSTHEHVNVTVHRNAANLGHGPSTLTALRLGLATNPDAVLAVDGDGQFTGSDVARVVAELLDGPFDIVEGVRTQRGDALYRRATSQVTRALVWSKCGSWPQDANSPLRAYRPAILRGLLDRIPESAMTPNLIISALSRRTGLRVATVPVQSRPRLGSTAQGTTWGARRQNLPSRRFITFCAKASGQWIRLS